MRDLLLDLPPANLRAMHYQGAPDAPRGDARGLPGPALGEEGAGCVAGGQPQSRCGGSPPSDPGGEHQSHEGARGTVSEAVRDTQGC